MERFRSYGLFEFQSTSLRDKEQKRIIAEQATDKVFPNGDNNRNGSLRVPFDLNQVIAIDILTDPKDFLGSEDFRHALPGSFSGQLVVIEFIDNDNSRLRTSPYGDLPMKVLDANRKPYLIDNIIVMDMHGQAAKYEIVTKRIVPKGEKERKGEYTPINLRIAEKDSRFVKVSDEDLQKIKTALDSI
ncbi:MAG: hypothetical protein HY425_03110 [Candidatus Levybacteria bacterium]|nr:hypothetical protein [Candidatus Levybacteria bacterium]